MGRQRSLTALSLESEKAAGRAFWDANPCGGDWGRYADFVAWLRETEPYMFELLARHDWVGRRVLEVGCGQGAALTSLPGLGATRVVGVDMSRTSLRRAGAGAAELGCAASVSVSVSDAERLPFPDQTFDAVISFGVLHHTPDTAGAIREVRRVLRPGGTAIVMLYRSGNPKWWATRTLMGISSLVDRVTGRRQALAARVRAGRKGDDVKGTALLELFGVPTMKAFSNRESRALFADFSAVTLTNCQPGFLRLADIVTLLRPFARLLRWLDGRTGDLWGFYQVIEARR